MTTKTTTPTTSSTSTSLTPYNPLKSTLRSILATTPLQRTFWNDLDEVYPGIYLGGVDSARNIEKLKQLKITHILNSSFSPKPMFSPFGIGTSAEFYTSKGLEVEFLGVPAVDFSGFKISKFFDEAVGFIDAAVGVEGKGKVLVHCFMGVSRSATLVLAYLMIKKGLRVEDALRIVSEKRSIHPNEGFLEQLCKLQGELDGERGSE